MPEFSRSATVDAAPDDLFQFLSKVENLPRYFSRMTEAHSATGDEVEVTAAGVDDDGGDVTAEAWFTIDADNRSLAWGSEGENDYKGELSVSPAGDAASTVEVTLHTEHDEPKAINAGLDETLANIQRLATSSALGD